MVADSAAPPTVVLVEDEDGLRESLLDGLSATLPEHAFHGFGSVEDAVAALGDLQPTLVVSDVRLPGQSGVDLLVYLKEHHPATGVILMSAYGPLIDGDELLRRGAVRFLKKPFALDELVSAVREHAFSERLTGQVEGISLLDIAQVLHVGRRNARITIESRFGIGTLSVRDGAIVDAQAGVTRGVAAAHALLGQSGGRFSVNDDESPCEAIIEEPFQFLMMESARLWDEGQIDLKAVFKGSSESLTEAQSAASAGDRIDKISEGKTMATTVDLDDLASLDGFIGACVVDSESGMVLGKLGGGERLNLDLAAAGNTEVVRAKRRAVDSLNLNSQIEDILISLEDQYHIIRPLKSDQTLFLYLALDRVKANLGMARHQAKAIEEKIKL